MFADGRVWTEWMAGAFERITGYTLDQVNRLDGGYVALLHPDDRVQVNPTPPVLVANQPSIHEYRIITRSGEVRWLRDYSRTLEAGPEAGSWHILGAVQDITARKQAEAALSEREAQYRAVIETSADGFWVVDMAGRLLEVNDAYIRRSGYSRAELLTMQIGDLDAQETPAGIAAHIERVVRHGNDLFQSRHRTKNGVIWPVEINTSYWPIVGGRLFVFIRDIGQRSRSEALLRTRLHLSELAVQGSLDELMQAALDAAELYTSSQIGFFHFVAPDQENLILQAWSTRTLQVMCQAEGKGLHYPISQAGVWVDCFYTRQPVIHNDYAGLPHRKGLPPGHTQVVRELVVPLLRNGLVTAIIGVGNKPEDYTQTDVEIMQELASIVMDVVARKQAEDALRENQLNLKSLIENTDGSIWSVDTEYRLIVGNNLFHRNVSAAIGRELGAGENLLTLDLPPAALAEWRGYYDRALRGEQFSIEVRTRFIVGERVVEYRLSPIRTAAGQISGATVFGRDITEHKEAEAAQAKLEEQLRQAHKMESVGRLAGGVAHDFNNLLTVIRGYSDLILDKTPPSDPRFEMTEQISRAAERAANLTRQLLAFSRRQLLAPISLDLNDLVANLNKMLGRLIGEDIILSTLLEPGLWPVTADPGQMEQVIVNLVVNARDAMPTGGKLTIETRNVQLDPGFARTYPEAPTGPCVLLAVTDTGHGMDAPTLAQIFEPFFTTKEFGHGTGLGLATVYGIIKQSGGDIMASSQPGQGTTFKIYLPARQAAAVIGPNPAIAASSPRGHETILLVEDESGVRGLVQQTLADQGYTILEAGHGRQALTLSGQHPGPIDLLLTDVVMPEMSGRDLAEQLKAQRPHLKVLFMSGYTDDIVLRHGLLTAQVEFLPKPFSPRVLAVKVRELLDK
ncbi:MAG: PAS domain S-box protein [Anaerolineales bacterium]|nr:PAS domain S-box protein [Anaerolineales bacterium]